MDKKLHIVSAGKSEVSITAGYRKNILFVQSVTEKKIQSQADFAKFRNNMQVFKKRGFLVSVNETMPRYAPGFNNCNLSEIDANGQPRLVAALTAYQYLQSRSAIQFAEGVRSISVPHNVYDKEVSDKGVVSYRIDWDSISENAIAMLATVYNCFNHSSTEETYLTTVFGLLNKNRRHTNSMAKFTRGNL
ncbi:hypothetical protein HWV00_21115 (plasmid) [Moritella sp. 24]|uniref:hypothetical protein n=1 Tax=Moritella sp. 24 TaxID=2746230 RepID=UPI001BA570B3|nr:hypothetical protein [Moritella sp. 24]QUM78776.1 hypothetical protein HWV00_21115 [Moritella sp. 24]